MPGIGPRTHGGADSEQADMSWLSNLHHTIDVCECLDEPHIKQWYAPYCENATQAYNGTRATSNLTWVADVAFEQVNTVTILMALLTGLAMVALIWLAVMFARFRATVTLHHAQQRVDCSQKY